MAGPFIKITRFSPKSEAYVNASTIKMMVAQKDGSTMVYLALNKPPLHVEEEVEVIAERMALTSRYSDKQGLLRF